MSHGKVWLLIHRWRLKNKGWDSVVLCNMDANCYNEIFELKLYRLTIIPNPFGAFDVMEEKVKLAWYVEKEWGIVVGGASSTQERKYFSLEETKYQVLCCCCHFSSYMEKTPRNWNNASKEPFTGKKNTEVKAIPMTQFKHKHLRGQLPSFHVYLLYTQPLSLQKHKGERADSHL